MCIYLVGGALLSVLQQTQAQPRGGVDEMRNRQHITISTTIIITIITISVSSTISVVISSAVGIGLIGFSICGRAYIYIYMYTLNSEYKYK